jgi:hypothetical protein
MPIIASEIKMYKSATVSDGSANGGRMSAVEAVSGVKNNIWPDVPETERTAGSTKYRKIFIKIADTENLALQGPNLYFTQRTPGDDYVVMMAGTQTNTQGDLTGSERIYGCGALNSNVSSGASSVTVNVETGAHGASGIFQNGDTVWISDGSNAEKHLLHSSTGVSWNGTQATLTFAGSETLASSYLAANTVVASVYAPSDIQTSVSNWVETSGSGTYDETTYPPVLDNIGSVEQTWTITFSSATNFTCTGNTVGSVGSGVIGSNFAPSNTGFSRPYFTLNSAGWGGTWANGNTVVFQTHPAATPIWFKRVVPAGAGSLSLNSYKIKVDGASA